MYEEFWPDTRSELAVPLMVNAEVRVGCEVCSATKPIGVLNVESPLVGAFSKADEECLSTLARQASLVVERIEFDEKLKALASVERDIVAKMHWHETIPIVLKGITKTLGFDFVNLSLVKPTLNIIQTEYVMGIDNKRVDEFKKSAVHALDSNDIQAHIVRTKEIEVPAVNDPRFDQAIYKRFRHEKLIRVFVPMTVSPNERVIGTVDAGYSREFRLHIYERDIQILKGFVDYAGSALEQRKIGLMDNAFHELNSPIIGMRGNASFLHKRWKELSDDKIERKLTDIITDGEIAQFQVNALEYMMGGKPPASKPESTLVFRDVILKTILQLRSRVKELGLDPDKVYCDEGSFRVRLYIEKAKFNQVVYNLLINAIKYVADPPSSFAVRVSLDMTMEHFIFKFKDWGIGVPKGMEEQIFDLGFRSPEAMRRNMGSGLGLTISRAIMKDLGGDIRLVAIYKPTEFHVLLPRSLAEHPGID